MTSSFTTIGGSGTTVNSLPYDTMSSNGQSSSPSGTSNTPGGTAGASGASSGINVASSLSTTSAADLQTTFLKLLVTQLQNQDPTSPVDSSQMTSQLAQIGRAHV